MASRLSPDIRNGSGRAARTNGIAINDLLSVKLSPNRAI
jgi:hypothetical protein